MMREGYCMVSLKYELYDMCMGKGVLSVMVVLVQEFPFCVPIVPPFG
jgi:hypothetical protein